MAVGRSVIVSVKRVWVALAAISLFIIGASLVLGVGKRYVWRGDPYGIVEIFRLNGEENVPAFFSALLMILCSGLLALVFRVKVEDGIRRWFWPFLSCVFLFLAFDELFEVHERLIEPLRESWDLSGLFYFAWVLVYGPLAALLGAAFLPIWLKFVFADRLRFAAAAVLYMTGAVGFEMLGGAQYEAAEVTAGGDILYSLLSTAEESLEMAGLVTFVAALLYLVSRDGPLTVRIASGAEDAEPGP